MCRFPGALDLAELADFVERGAATFGQGPLDPDAQGGGAWAGGAVESDAEKQRADARKAAAKKRPLLAPEVGAEASGNAPFLCVHVRDWA
jgi:hypothetical protein